MTTSTSCPTPLRRPSARRGAFCFLAALAVCLAPALGWASGLYLPGRGVKPLGRAGAYIASSGGDLNSLWYNPSGLAGLEGTTLTLDVAIIDLAFEFDRAPRTRDNGEVTTYDPVSSSAAPIADPQLLVGGKLPWLGDDFSWGFGVYAPYTSPATFPEDGAQRYTLVDSNGSLLVFLNGGLGWQVSENLRLGFGVQNVVATLKQVSVSSGYAGVFGDQEDEDLDLLSRVDINSYFSPSANFGLWIKLFPGVEGAASVQLPARLSDSAAKLTTRLPSHPAFDDAYLDGDTLQASLTLPLIARGALRYNHSKFDVEVAAVYEAWSMLDEISIVPNDIFVRDVRGVGDIKVQPLNVPLNYQDAFSVRAGFDFKLTDRATARGGYTYETAAIPDAYYSVRFADGDKHMFGLGGSWASDNWTLDASFAYYLMPDRVITNSQTRQINPTDSENELTLVVGNGTYRQRFLVGGLAFTYAF